MKVATASRPPHPLDCSVSTDVCPQNDHLSRGLYTLSSLRERTVNESTISSTPNIARLS